MLTTNLTTVHRCRSCGSERLKKNGHNASGSQRARCLECHCTFVLEPKPPRYSEEERQRIVRAATCERLSTRAIHRTFGPCYQTLRRWVEKKGERTARTPRNAAAGQRRRRAGAR